MAIEIERKFLVANEAWRELGSPVVYRQGYLNADKYRTVRVRVMNEQAVLTIKGVNAGASRLEFEYPIPVADATPLLELCEKPLIEKQRTSIPIDGLVWEVDEFLGLNQGLIVAEVELDSEDQSIVIPGWVGDEVTGDPRYYNSQLSLQPYSTWTD